MNVLLVSTNRNATPMPVMPAGVCMIAEAVERSGHNAAVIDLMFSDNPHGLLETAIAGFHPDVVGLSVRNIDNNVMKRPQAYIQDVRSMVQTVRKRTDALIVLGGAAVGVMPREILQTTGADICFAGPGEQTFSRLLEHIDRTGTRHDLPRIVTHNEPSLLMSDECVTGPFMHSMAPDYSRWIRGKQYRRSMTTAPIRTKLGCPYSCVYCTYGAIEGNTYRLAEPESVAETVRGLASSGLRNVEFVDSVFNSPAEHAQRLCEALAQKPHKTNLQSMDLNPRWLDDGLMTLMERAGFTGMGLTVESASDRVLRGLRKPFDAGDVHRAAETVARHHIPCAWIFLLGGPGETEETVAETLRFAERMIRPADVAFFNIGIRIYPGTELESIARRQGLLSLLPEEMLEPAFYVSPEVSYDTITGMVRNSVRNHMNFIDPDAFELPYLPALYRIGNRLGMQPPLWRHTRHIRRMTQLLGV